MAGTAGAVLLGACNANQRETSSPGGRPRLRIESWTQLGYPGPFTYTAGPGYWRMSLRYDTLTWPDSTGEQLPWLAKSYDVSEDGLSYSLELRNVAWSDGRPLTSRDVAFTYEYYSNEQLTPLQIGVPIEGAEILTTGDRSIEFRIDRPDNTFLPRVLGTMPIVPEHVWSGVTDPMAAFDEELFEVTTGAYRLTSRNETQDREAYEANDDYFLGTPYVRRIEMVSVNDPLVSLEQGDLDAAATDDAGVTDDLIDPFRENPEYGMVRNDAGFGFPLFFNMDRGGALADLRFRRACLHAIDRDDLVERLLTGNGQVGSPGWLPPASAWHNGGVRQYPFDRDEAERLLDEAGLPRSGRNEPRRNRDGSPLRYTLIMPDAIPIALAEVIGSSLSAVGIEIGLERMDLVRTFGAKNGANYDLLITSYPGPGGTGPTGDPELLRGVFYSNPPNHFHKATGYTNPEVDALIDAQRAELDSDQRLRQVHQVQEKVAEDLPVAMLYYTTFFYIFRKSVFDAWYYTPGGFATGIPEPYNKHAYITGRKEGLEVRETSGQARDGEDGS